MIAALAWRNIWRQPTRTALSMVGMSLTSALLVFMLSFQFGSYDTMKASMLQIADGFGQFQPLGYKDDPETAKIIPDPDGILREIQMVGGVSMATPRTLGFGLLANGERSFAAAINGIDPTTEPKVSTLTTHITQGRGLTADDTQAIVLGDGLARNLKLALGQPVTLLGSGADGSVAADVLTLVGIFKSSIPELDRVIAQMPLERFKETFLMEGAVNVIAVTGPTVRAVEQAGPALDKIAAKHGLVYLDWAELRPEVRESISFDMATSMLMYLTLVIVVVFIILNTLYMSVLERTREFGVLLAIGMKRSLIGRVIWAEMIFLALLGCGVGMVIGIGVTTWVQQVGIAIEGYDEIYAQWGLPSRFYPAMTPFRVLLGPMALVIAITIMGIIPYRRVLKLQAVSAMS